MPRQIPSQSPQWKSVTAARSGQTPVPYSILPKIEKIVHEIGKDLSAFVFQKKAEVAAREIEQQLSRMGYEVTPTSQHKTPQDTIMWGLINMPLLAAIEQGLEEHLNKYIADYFEGMRFNLVDDLYLKLGEQLLETMQQTLTNYEVKGFKKPRLQVVSESIQIYVDDFPLEGLNYDDPFWTNLDKALTGVVQDFERKMGVQADIRSPEIVPQYGNALVFSVYFENG